MTIRNAIDRRGFLRAGTGTALFAGSAGLALGAEEEEHGESEEEGISPNEDLMREHGVVLRVVTIHGEVLRRMRARKDVPVEAVSEAAHLTRRFIEDYHEKLEENHVFPRVEKAGRLTRLVGTLKTQHAAGRKVTDRIMRLCDSGIAAGEDSGRELGRLLRAFSRMYLPHMGREDTVLFPAFRSLFTQEAFMEMGEQFEEQEHELFGEDGFDRMVGEVAALEKKLEIGNLDRFTPKI
jgi:hemerythrin-like domain-containing protein